jgi:formylglycine-generating enzyme required for sulfatase activity
MLQMQNRRIRKMVLLLFGLSISLLGCAQKTEKDSLIKPAMVKVSGGTFMMGQNDGEADEKPVHEVTISDFLIGKFEVTVSEYSVFCDATGRPMPTEPEWGWIDSHPIINTSWEDAMAFINWLNDETSDSYRLPSEAELEFVIREGGQPGIYPWGNGLPKNENIADESFKNKTSSTRIWQNYNDEYPYTAPVGSFPPNKLGVHDINGNIWEWCSDWYASYTNDKSANPMGPNDGTNKVGRGASYDADPWHARTASRAFVEPSFKRPGFRLAKDVK